MILPPSRSSEGVYKVADWRPPALAPAWLRQLGGRLRVSSEQYPDGLPDREDLPDGLDVAELVAGTGTDDGAPTRSA